MVDIDPSIVFPKARKLYEEGFPLDEIKRRLHLNDSEMRDVAPEEFEDEFTDIEPGGACG